jgi:hypothetical protein
MKHSLTTIALGALLLSQSVLAGLYSSKDNVIDITPKNFQAEVMDSNVRLGLVFRTCSCSGIEQGEKNSKNKLTRPFSFLDILFRSMLSWSSSTPHGAAIVKSKES